mgnify:CR=1 FL=1
MKKLVQQIRTIDFMPTILDFLKIPFDNNYEKIDGRPDIGGIKLLWERIWDPKVSLTPEARNPSAAKNRELN